MHTFEAAKIKKDIYFLSVIHENIDHISDDLRILHSPNKKDTQIASDDTSGLSNLIEILQKLKDYKAHHSLSQITILLF